MNIEINAKGQVTLTEVYCGVLFRCFADGPGGGHGYRVCMRDNGLEIICDDNTIVEVKHDAAGKPYTRLHTGDVGEVKLLRLRLIQNGHCVALPSPLIKLSERYDIRHLNEVVLNACTDTGHTTVRWYKSTNCDFDLDVEVE